MNTASARPTHATRHAGWRVLAHALLALLVLLAQQGAWRHHLSHWVGTGPTQVSHVASSGASHAFEPIEAPCLQCLAFAALADTLRPLAAQAAAPDLTHVCEASRTHTARLASALLAYRSRAPPRA